MFLYMCIKEIRMSILSRIKSIISTLSFSDVEIDSVGAACDKYLNNDLHDDPTWSRLSQRDRERIKIQVQSSFQKAWRNLRVQNLKLTQKGQSVSVESLSRSQKLLQVHPAEEPDKFGEGLRSEEHTSELQSHVNLVCR